VAAGRLERLRQMRLLQVPAALGLEPLVHIARQHMRGYSSPGPGIELRALPHLSCCSIHRGLSISGRTCEASRGRLGRSLLKASPRSAIWVILGLAGVLALQLPCLALRPLSTLGALCAWSRPVDVLNILTGCLRGASELTHLRRRHSGLLRGSPLGWRGGLLLWLLLAGSPFSLVIVWQEFLCG
jgi:hypothetical protein